MSTKRRGKPRGQERATKPPSPALAIPGGDLARRLEIPVVLAAAITLIALHVLFLRHAGGLWRDEVNSVEIATMRNWHAIGMALGRDSFPAGYTALLRLWLELPWTGGVAGVRAFGLLAGLVVLLAITWSARVFGARTPWLALMLFGWNAVAIRATDSIRPYGLGAAAAVLAFTAVWRLIERPVWSRVAWAALAAIAAVQMLYPDALLVLGIVVAGVLVSLRRGVGVAARVVAVGIAALVSLLLPYGRALSEAREWAPLVRFPFGYASMWQELSTAMASGSSLMVPVTLMLAAALVVRAAFPSGGSDVEAGREATDRRRYAAATVVISAAAVLLFLHATGFPTKPWYYVPMLALVAAALNAGFADASPRRGKADPFAAWAPVLGVAIVAVMTWSGVSSAVRVRQTNLDLVARKLAADATVGDLILVNPWYVAVGFQHHYHGGATVMTLPTLQDLKIHRYDLMKQKLQEEAPIRDVLDSLEATLRAGRRVWLVGGLTSPPAGQEPPSLPPLVGEALARLDGPMYISYLSAWATQAGALVARHAMVAQRVDIPVPDPVNPYENVFLLVESGWHDAVATSAGPTNAPPPNGAP